MEFFCRDTRNDRVGLRFKNKVEAEKAYIYRTGSGEYPKPDWKGRYDCIVRKEERQCFGCIQDRR